jgi:HlyD family secretion protein
VIGAFALARKGAPQYFTARIERGDVRDVVESTGTINAVTTVLVGSQISGRIARLRADFNSVVRKGQVIAEIDPALFEGALLQANADLKTARVNVLVERANLEKARAVLAQTKADFDRSVTLAKQDSIALQAVDLSKSAYESAVATVDAAEAAVQQAEAQVEQKAGAVAVARTNLEYTVIRSPIDGTVVARNVDVGQTVAASLQAPTLFTIAQDLTKMQVYAKTDESNVGKMKVGRAVTFKVDAFPKDAFKGVVSQVRMNPTTVQNVVTYDAIIDFDNPELKLFPGMTAYVTIPVASAENVLKVPNGALRFMPRSRATSAPGAQLVVWKLGPGNTLEPVELALGITDHSYTAVTRVVSGELREGDSVVTGAVAATGGAAARPAFGAPPRK